MRLIGIEKRRDMKLMTPGPTQVRANVRAARSKMFCNPDLDPAFYDFYKETCDLLEKALGATDHRAFILGGEGILGLEAACASLTEPGDRVLVIDNGIFGKGFQDFVEIYGGEAVLFTTDYLEPVDPEALRAFLSKDSDFKYATMVHCDTPSGVLNGIEALSRICDEYGIMVVADSVSAMFGERLNLSAAKIDILCGGSQKALSAPPGLTMVWVSQRAFQAMEERQVPIRSFYANLLTMKDYYQDQWFPYTMPVSDIMGLRMALDNFYADPDVYDRHERVARATRKAVKEMGLSLYLRRGMSNTVTVIRVPEGWTDQEIIGKMRKDYGIQIAGCFDYLAGKVIRIGHMGESCNMEDVQQTLRALGDIIGESGNSRQAG